MSKNFMKEQCFQCMFWANLWENCMNLYDVNHMFSYYRLMFMGGPSFLLFFFLSCMFLYESQTNLYKITIYEMSKDAFSSTQDSFFSKKRFLC